MPRHSRDFDALSEAQVAAGLIAPRRVSPSALLPSRKPEPISALLDSIQHVAEAATGERSFLHLKLDPSTVKTDEA